MYHDTLTLIMQMLISCVALAGSQLFHTRRRRRRPRL